MAISLTVTRIEAEFGDWDQLLALILEAFAYMEGRIDPPSSAWRLTVDALAAQADAGAAFAAMRQGDLVGCIFSEPRGTALYLSKLAVRPGVQGQGVGRALVAAAEAEARARGAAALELQTRIELTDNHAAFQALGFRETERTAHPGFDRPTSITMRRPL